VRLARIGWLVTFGIDPKSPETGFGYIRSGAPLPEGGLRAEAFLEKPDRPTAERLIARGGHFWNSGMFVFDAAVFLAEVARLRKEIPIASWDDLTEAYPRLPSWSIDVGIMEKTDKVAVVPATFDWSDLGDWEAVYQNLPKDSDGNVVRGRVAGMDNRTSLLWSEGGVLGALGLEDLIVIHSGKSVLVCPRDRAQEVKSIAESLPRADGPDFVARPWGRYTVLEEGPGYKIKRIVVDPGQKLSLQSHEHRAEHWVVIQGTARITNGDSVSLLEESESTFIPKGQRHRLENAGNFPLVIVEVQTGPYLDEDDIRRFDDLYGRNEGPRDAGASKK
jgi:mannose-1-phosphate guanylyltransferase/mannose-6-phosphate isomerase